MSRKIASGLKFHINRTSPKASKESLALHLEVKIYFESTYGQGCTFTISLPLYKEESINCSSSQIKDPNEENSFSYSYGLYEKKSENA